MVDRENSKQVTDGVIVMVFENLTRYLDATLEVGTLFEVEQLVHLSYLGKHPR